MLLDEMKRETITGFLCEMCLELCVYPRPATLELRIQ
jgi:hypothetical protein